MILANLDALLTTYKINIFIEGIENNIYTCENFAKLFLKSCNFQRYSVIQNTVTPRVEPL